MSVKQKALWKVVKIWAVLQVISLGILFIWYVLNIFPWSSTFHELPPPAIYNEVMGRPVPEGISHLHVAARQYLTKRWAWMRFQATDKAIQQLVKEYDVTDQASAIMYLGGGMIADHKYDTIDKKSVDWDGLSRISHPEYYQLPATSRPDSFLWIGYIVVDRAHRMIYIQASGD